MAPVQATVGVSTEWTSGCRAQPQPLLSPSLEPSMYQAHSGHTITAPRMGACLGERTLYLESIHASWSHLIYPKEMLCDSLTCMDCAGIFSSVLYRNLTRLCTLDTTLRSNFPLGGERLQRARQTLTANTSFILITSASQATLT